MHDAARTPPPSYSPVGRQMDFGLGRESPSPGSVRSTPTAAASRGLAGTLTRALGMPPPGIPSANALSGAARAMSAVRWFLHCEETNPRFRNQMEDACVCVDNFANERTTAFFAVYDGHGGRQALDYVIRKLHDVLVHELVRSDFDVKTSLEKTFLKIDDQLRLNGSWNAGTTATVFVVRREGHSNKQMLYCANVGDSRGVLVRADNSTLRLTQEHKATDAHEAERVTRAGGIILRNRVGGQLAVSRALGDHSLKSEGLTAFPHVVKRDVTANRDRFLIAASDGLWDVLDDSEAAEIAGAALGSMMDGEGGSGPEMAAKNLVYAALSKGSRDNIIAVVVVF